MKPWLACFVLPLLLVGTSLAEEEEDNVLSLLRTDECPEGNYAAGATNNYPIFCGCLVTSVGMGLAAHGVPLCSTGTCEPGTCVILNSPATFVEFLNAHGAFDIDPFAYAVRFRLSSLEDLSKERLWLPVDKIHVRPDDRDLIPQLADWLGRRAIVIGQTSKMTENRHGNAFFVDTPTRRILCDNIEDDAARIMTAQYRHRHGDGRKRRLEGCLPQPWQHYVLVTNVAGDRIQVNDPACSLGEKQWFRKEWFRDFTLIYVRAGACLAGNTDVVSSAIKTSLGGVPDLSKPAGKNDFGDGLVIEGSHKGASLRISIR